MDRLHPFAALAASCALLGCQAEAPRAPLAAAPAEQASAAPAPLPPPEPAAATSPALPPPSPEALAAIHVPASVAAGERRPFVLYLHGLGASGKALVGALGIPALAEDLRVSYAAPEGATNAKKQRFWNASRACCDFDGAAVDHVSALRGLLDAARAHPSVDPRRVYVVGFSNGGFMAHRLACEVDGIAGIASVAGAGPAADDPPCTPRGPVAVLQIQGDADKIVGYAGGRVFGRPELSPHPSAVETVAAWARRDGCAAGPSAAGALDLGERAEAQAVRYGGCARGVELWTVPGGGHVIAQGRRALEAILAKLSESSLP